MRTLANERINKIAPETGDEIFSYSSTPHDQHVFRVRHRKIDSNAPREARTHDGIRCPYILVGRGKTVMREDKIGNKAVDIGLQQNPSRFRLAVITASNDRNFLQMKTQTRALSRSRRRNLPRHVVHTVLSPPPAL